MRSLFACLRSFVLMAAVLAVGGILTACSGGLEKPLALLDSVREKGEMVADRTAEKAAEAVDLYCVQVPPDMRARMRDHINARTVHGDIVVTCAGD